MEMIMDVSTVSPPSIASTVCPHPGQTDSLICRLTDFSGCADSTTFKMPNRHLTLLLQFLGGFVKFQMRNKKIMILLLILLNILIVGAAKRNRHTFRLCANVDKIDYPTLNQCSTIASRKKRNAYDTMTLWEGQTTSLCAYGVCVDRDEARRPVNIHRVFCRQSGCQCAIGGVYNCVQLYDKMEVWYPGTNSTSRLDIQFGCVCARRRGRPGKPFVPDVVERDVGEPAE